MKSAAFQFSGTPAELLRRLGMAGQLLETVKSYSGLSVDEILACAKGVASDSRVRNLAGVLAHRLACPRGLEQELKRAASGLSIKPDLLAFQQHIQLLRMRRRLG